MKPNKEQTTPLQAHDTPEMPAVSEVHPHEQPITNCYQLFLNIRKQVCTDDRNFILKTGPILT